VPTGKLIAMSGIFPVRIKTYLAVALAAIALVHFTTAADPVHVDAKCPTCSTSLVTVPILIGFPSKQMEREFELGHVLLGGCIGNPSKPETAFVCLKCRKWTTGEMKSWQDLPSGFGKKASTP
jgi:hypothetical protein